MLEPFLRLPAFGHRFVRIFILQVDQIEGDARVVLANMMTEGTLHRVMVFFPDPWPKSKHHKRRLINAGFAALVAQRLGAGGELQVATDWEHYADAMRVVLEAEPGLQNVAGEGWRDLRVGWGSEEHADTPLLSPRAWPW